MRARAKQVASKLHPAPTKRSLLGNVKPHLIIIICLNTNLIINKTENAMSTLGNVVRPRTPSSHTLGTSAISFGISLPLVET